MKERVKSSLITLFTQLSSVSRFPNETIHPSAFFLCQAIGNRNNLSFPRNTCFCAFNPLPPVLRTRVSVSRLASVWLGWRLVPPFSFSQRRESHIHSRKPVQEVLHTHQKDPPLINLDHNCFKESPSPSLLPNSACSQEMHANHLNPGQQCCTC